MRRDEKVAGRNWLRSYLSVLPEEHDAAVAVATRQGSDESLEVEFAGRDFHVLLLPSLQAPVRRVCLSPGSGSWRRIENRLNSVF